MLFDTNVKVYFIGFRSVRCNIYIYIYIYVWMVAVHCFVPLPCALYECWLSKAILHLRV